VIIADRDAVVVLFTNGGTHQCEFLGIPGTGKTARWLDAGFYPLHDVGNGVSELAAMAIQALDSDDEVLIPSPEFPRWTADPAGRRECGTYACDEVAGWLPNLGDIAARITGRANVRRAVEVPPGRRVPRRVAGGLRPPPARPRLPGGPDHARRR
jgi:hypothetical protein